MKTTKLFLSDKQINNITTIVRNKAPLFISTVSLVLCLSFLFYSCDKNDSQDKKTPEEKAFLQKKAKFRKMYEGLGLEWKEDSQLSAEDVVERDEIIRKDDIKEAEQMLKWLMIMDRQTREDLGEDGVKKMEEQMKQQENDRKDDSGIGTVRGGVTHTIEGRSVCSGINISSVQRVSFVINGEGTSNANSLTIKETHIQANVGGPWSPNVNTYGPHNFIQQLCNFTTTGNYRYLKNWLITMRCRVKKSSSGMFQEGEVYSCTF